MLQITNLQKSFGKNKVIDGLDLTVPNGTVFGFLGANGSGKTTTMKMIMGFLRRDGGTILVDNQPVVFGKTMPHIGYLPDVPAFYPYMKPKQYLKLCADLSGMKNSESKIQDLLAMVGLDGASRSIKGFSRGMMQRLGIAQALLNDPKLLLCDEPTSALDPIGRKEILDILKNIHGSQTCLIFSTHILADVERICDSYGILKAGKIQRMGKMEDLKKSCLGSRIELEVKTGGEELAQAIKQLPRVSSVKIKEESLLITTEDLEQTGADLIRLIADRREPLLHYQIAEPTLEEVFVEVNEQ